jgi:hypothetical protein
MAQGDITFFEEALAKMLSGDWASTDHWYLMICDNTATPAADTGTPVIGDFTEVGEAGTYVADGTDLGTIDSMVAEVAGVVTIDSATNPTWAKHALSDVDAWWGIIYNYTDAQNDCLCFVELDGPVDMTAGALTVTWNGTGIVTITIT